MKEKLHPSHKTRSSDASTFDIICTVCGNTDQVPGGWGELANPCYVKRITKREKIKAEIGMMSLVGVGGEYPLGFGNYFDFHSRGGYCVNMWAENLKEWKARTGMTEIEIVRFGDCAFVTDPSIPKKWLHQNLCFTGSGNAAQGVKSDILDFAAEFFGIDRKVYATRYEPSEKSGWTKIPGGYTITNSDGGKRTVYDAGYEKVEMPPMTKTELDVKWTTKTEMEPGTVYAPYKPMYHKNIKK